MLHTYFEKWKYDVDIGRLQLQDSSEVIPNLSSKNLYVTLFHLCNMIIIVSSNDQIICIHNKNHQIFTLLSHIQIIIISLRWKQTFLRYSSIFAYKALGACFSPYKALINLQTLCSYPSISKPGGWVIYTSSYKSSLRKTLFTSIWWTFHPFWVASASVN